MTTAPTISDPADSRIYFDAFTRIGPRAFKHPAESWSLEHLLEEMEHCSVAGALVCDTQSVQYDPLYANRRLSQRLKGALNLYTVWNLLPHQTGEFPCPEALLRHLREEEVAAVSIYPDTNAWDFLSSRYGPLFHALEDGGYPMMIHRSQFKAYADLERFLSLYPQMKVILTGAVWTEQRLLLPILKDYPNLHITFERFQIFNGLERLVQDGLENQLLYGSEAPLRTMGAHRAYIDYAQLSDVAKTKIAGGNLKRLLGGRGPSEAALNPLEDPFMKAARRGQPVEHLDMHMHVLDDGLNGGGGHYRMESGDAQGILSLVSRLGCVGGGIMSWNGTVSCDAEDGNRVTRTALDHLPESFWGLASFDPTHYSREQLLQQIPAAYQDARFIGMKPYFYYGMPYHHQDYADWWQYGNRKGYYALLHRVKPDFSEVSALAERYPNVRWVVAHTASDFGTADQAIQTAQAYDNVYLDITFTSTLRGIVEYLAEGAGSDRIVYGSDAPMRDPRQQLGWVIFSRLSPSGKRKILFENGRNIANVNIDCSPYPQLTLEPLPLC